MKNIRNCNVKNQVIIENETSYIESIDRYDDSTDTDKNQYNAVSSKGNSNQRTKILEEYYKFSWRILPKVSRSFALCIKLLPKKTKDAVMISYLMCRIADTIEDSTLGEKEKKKFLSFFIKIFRAQLNPTAQQELEILGITVAEATPEKHERTLILNANKIFECYYSLPHAAQKSIRKWVTEMAKGMKKYHTPRIKSLSEQNIYCYYVAVTVGHLLTDLFHDYGHLSDKTHENIHALSRDFGLGLQKVNIIRDLRKDIKEGRNYWPEEILEKQNLKYHMLDDPKHKNKIIRIAKELIKDAMQHLNKALEYVLMIPDKEEKIRVFCCIPLFMAVASLNKVLENINEFINGQVIKISRAQVMEIVSKSIRFARSDDSLRNWYLELSSFSAAPDIE